MNKTLKKNIGLLHLWLGLISGVVVFIVALTGSILVFEEEIDEFFNPEFYKTVNFSNKKMPVDSIISELQKEFHLKKIDRIHSFSQPERSLVISATDSEKKKQIFSIDPYNGKVLASVPAKRRFFSIVLDLHRHLVLDDFGKAVTGISCIIFVLMLLSGLVIWWPAKIKNLKRRLTVKWDASLKRVNWDFHSTFGFYTFLILLTISLTGLTWSYQWFENGVYFLADGTADKMSAKVKNPHQTNLKRGKLFFYQEIFSKTDSVYRYTGDTQVRIPSDSVNSIMVIKMNLDAEIPNTASIAYFDRYTGELVETRPYESLSRGGKLMRLMYPIHTGSIYGYPTKILAFLVCLFAVTLPITGLLIWLGRKKHKK